ncbi:zinc finger protein GAI-ASSOCIATED FACTOR 1-like [Zingiber officinale]|uniref:zinc finger protein GAI-ASSOCIATED FACTOR 1-like n=1 Tax=Zingiber officinale TaxID=94328 RepID=UPI001C4CE95C|nr:zinc finger protein GAI-ASSOCIATED FACTOR 1-like [Zingiber officinale]
MSNITGDGGSFCSGNKSAGEDDAHKQSYMLYNPAAAVADASADVSATLLPQTMKKKRNLPGTPDPNAEVVALSPKTLMATNRFVCEICHKGFQRDQNLQLHRRGHNLPWKLRQRSSSEVVRKRVYVCPEPACVHHDPGRALGDLTGIKKHFCRKHGEKKWKCDKCAKKYAVQSDWKAHAKICGTREYKCDCGTIFARRDSFITHRAFCDALAQENANKLNQPLMATMASNLQAQASTRMTLKPPHLSADLPAYFPRDSKGNSPELGSLADQFIPPPADMAAGMISSFLPNLPGAPSSRLQPGPVSFCGLDATAFPKPPSESFAHMSATALLQKAAQMGATVAGGGNRGALASMMAGPDRRAYGGPFKAHGPFQLGRQLFDPSVSEVVGLVAGDGSALKHMARCGSGDVTTVDFLGLEGERRLHMQQQQQQQLRRMETLHGLQQQQHHTEMENALWEL